MRNINKRVNFLNTYRRHLRHELDQMEIGGPLQESADDSIQRPDYVISAIAMAAMALMFAGIFLV